MGAAGDSLGNGFMGAMVHGGVAVNQIQLNDHTLWSGGPGASSSYKCGMKGDADAIHRTLHEVQGEVQKMADYFAEHLAPKQQPDGSWQIHDYAEYPGYGGIKEKVESMFGEKIISAVTRPWEISISGIRRAMIPIRAIPEA